MQNLESRLVGAVSGGLGRKAAEMLRFSSNANLRSPVSILAMPMDADESARLFASPLVAERVVLAHGDVAKVSSEVVEPVSVAMVRHHPARRATDDGVMEKDSSVFGIWRRAKRIERISAFLSGPLVAAQDVEQIVIYLRDLALTQWEEFHMCHCINFNKGVH